MSGLSAVLITLNAERHLAAVLAPLGFCREIVILDSGSTDATRAIAAAAGARVLAHPFDDFGAQKRRAVAAAGGDWILALDADEVLDALAAAAVAALDWAGQDECRCWRVNRRPFVGSREVRHGHWVPDRLVRVFNRRRTTFSTHPVHPTVTPVGPVVDLPGNLLHYCYPDLAAVFATDYHRRKAAYYRRQGRTATGPTLALRVAGVFVRSYLLRRGFLDGPTGVVVALAGAVNAALGLAMASEDAATAPGSPAPAPGSTAGAQRGT